RLEKASMHGSLTIYPKYFKKTHNHRIDSDKAAALPGMPTGRTYSHPKGDFLHWIFHGSLL
ncbi:MAG: hypothetical protein M0T82_08460, partial [Desulfobacteraceae bacterium]|nr:hypothetical protein [Desulfobacteraceae bacterium]